MLEQLWGAWQPRLFPPRLHLFVYFTRSINIAPAVDLPDSIELTSLLVLVTNRTRIGVGRRDSRFVVKVTMVRTTRAAARAGTVHADDPDMAAISTALPSTPATRTPLSETHANSAEKIRLSEDAKADNVRTKGKQIDETGKVSLKKAKSPNGGFDVDGEYDVLGIVDDENKIFGSTTIVAATDESIGETHEGEQ